MGLSVGRALCLVQGQVPRLLLQRIEPYILAPLNEQGVHDCYKLLTGNFRTMSMTSGAFVQTPLTLQPLGGPQNARFCTARNSSFALKPTTLQRSRCPSRWRCTADNDKTISFVALEAEIRQYLDGCEDPGPSPLAYTNLGEAGRTDLISRIMEHGGYLQVSRRLGVPVDESNFISPPSVPIPNTSLFNQEDGKPSLVMGRDLEARLGTVGQVIEDSKVSGNALSSSQRRALRAGVPSGQELRSASEQFIPPVTDEPLPKGERFSLTASMRLGMVLLAAVTAVGFGRASSGVVNEDTIATCRLMAEALAVAHLAVGIYAGGVLAARYNRSRLLWSAKVLLSGPLGLQHLRSLGSL